MRAGGAYNGESGPRREGRMIPMLQAKCFTHSKGSEGDLEPGSPSPRQDPPKKPYQSPALVEWGSIVEMTRGPLADTQDDDFSGSGGF